MKIDKSQINSTLKIIKTGSLIFSALVIVILGLNYFNLKNADPLNENTKHELLETIDQNPENEKLKEDYRSLNLIARKAFFTSRDQMDIGKIILAVSLFLFFLSAQIQMLLFKPNPAAKGKQATLKRTKVITQIAVLIFPITLIGLAFIFTNTGSAQKIEYISLEKSNEGNWNHFRNLGQAVETKKNLPLSWDEESGENIQWKVNTDIIGYSSPVLWEDKIFLSGGTKQQFQIQCRDLNMGNITWEYLIDINDPDSLPFVQEDTGYAASTPAADKDGIYVIFANGQILALDHSGILKWEKKFETPDNHYGHSSSLLVYDGNLFIQYDTNTVKFITALNTETGEEIWKKTRDNEISWTSPILAEWKDKVYLLTNADPFVSAYEPYSGTLLWETECISGEAGSSLAYSNGIVSAAQYRSQVCSIDIESGKLLWAKSDDLPEAPSLISSKGILLTPSNYGLLIAFDTLTGNDFWFFETDRNFYASPIIANDVIYISTFSGTTHILKLAEELEELGTGRLNNEIFATPAVTESGLVFRTKTALFLITEKSEN